MSDILMPHRRDGADAKSPVALPVGRNTLDAHLQNLLAEWLEQRLTELTSESERDALRGDHSFFVTILEGDRLDDALSDDSGCTRRLSNFVELATHVSSQILRPVTERSLARFWAPELEPSRSVQDDGLMNETIALLHRLRPSIGSALTELKDRRTRAEQRIGKH